MAAPAPLLEPPNGMLPPEHVLGIMSDPAALKALQQTRKLTPEGAEAYYIRMISVLLRTWLLVNTSQER